MKVILTFPFRRCLTPLLALLVINRLHAQPVSPSPSESPDPFASAASLETVLDRSWNRQAYLAAYTRDYDQPDWDAFSKQLRERQKWGRNDIWDLQPYAMLYHVTGNRKYSQVVQSALLSIAEHPPVDLTFSLSAVCYLFEKVRGDLSATDRAKVEAAIAAGADTAMKGESGTAMNRGLLNAFGLAYAARVLPDNPRSAVWNETQRLWFARDFERIQDTNEDSTNYHFVFGEALIRYVQLVTRDPREFYARPYVKAMFERWLGLATPFGGFPTFGKSGWHYPELAEVYEAAGAGFHDGRYRWLAQRILNYARANGQKMPNTPILDYLDDSIVPVPPSGSSFFNDLRMGQKVADKLVIRSGFGADDTYAALDLLNEGGHGTEDATALVTLIDHYAPLLVNPLAYQPEEANRNVLLFRRSSEKFPFSDIGPGNDPEWRRVIRPIRFQHTVLGGPNIDFQNITGMGLRLESIAPGKILIDDLRLINGQDEKIIDDFESTDGLSKNAALSPDAVEGKHSGAFDLHSHISFPWPGTMDLRGYDAVEFWYRLSPVPAVPLKMQGEIDSPESVGRWGFFDTYRQTHLRFLRDAPDFHAASLDIMAKPYFGGSYHQFRDTLILPGRLVWVRDTVQPLDEKELQFGPLWHVDKVLNQGSDWIQSTQSPFEGAARGHTADWKFPSRNLLVRIIGQQPDSRIQSEEYTVSGGASRHVIYGNWKGIARPGQTYAFDSFLLPNSVPGVQASAIASEVKVVQAGQEWTLIQLDDDYLLLNPLGRPVHAAGIETDCLALRLHAGSGSPVIVQAVQGKYARFQGTELYRSANVSNSK